MMRPQRILIGREPELAAPLLERIAPIRPYVELHCLPLIQTQPVDFHLSGVYSYEKTPQVLMVTSSRSVPYIPLALLEHTQGSICVGRETAKQFSARFHRSPDWIAAEESSRGLIDLFLKGLIKWEKDTLFIHPSSNLSGDDLGNALKAFGYNYRKLVTYKTTPAVGVEAFLKSYPLSTFALVVFYSPSGVENLCRWEGATDTCTAIAIGGKTALALREKGWQRILESKTPHSQDISELLINCINYRITS